ncbi:MAG TPA: nucleoside-diphosphate kinase [Candidatus Nanoarchaeia archaeon]|nr:nucleoside-diphosphate kinase [Candidatus Nanoarchaeia archaeon]
MTEKTLVIIKPDALTRGIVGEIIHRFERKGLKIIGLKLSHLSEAQLQEHYAHHKGKPFFNALIDFMRSAPSVLVALEGLNCVDIVRRMAGETSGHRASPGTIRGDYSLSNQNNIVHASDSPEAAEAELKRFFKDGELYHYNRIDVDMLYAKDERK